MGAIICDSSTLISLSQTCNIGALGFLSKNTKAAFFITPAVEREIVFNPLNFTQHAFSAIRLKKQVQDGVLKIVKENPRPEYDALNDLTNKLYAINSRPLKILQAGELECLAVYKKMNASGIMVDEKTARLIVESPKILLDALRTEYHSKVEMNEGIALKLAEAFKGIKVVRSTEVLALAYEKGYFDGFKGMEKEAFHAAAYAARNAGCSITGKELSEYEKMK